MDEGDVQPVVGQLVDKHWPVGLALDARPAEVFLAQRLQLGGVELGQALRIGTALRQGRDVGQFLRALDHRVARQDLFDQGRAGARHAQDEDGVARVVADALAFGKEFRREQIDALIDEIARVLRVITVRLAAQGVAGLIVRK